MQFFVHFLRGSSHFDQRLRQVQGFVRQAPGATHLLHFVLRLRDDLRVPPAADLWMAWMAWMGRKNDGKVWKKMGTYGTKTMEKYGKSMGNYGNKYGTKTTENWTSKLVNL